MIRLTLAPLIALLAIGCTGRAPRPATAEVSDQPQGLAIVRLVGQHQTITVTSGPNGPLYSAQTNDGEPIVANATLEELRREHPEVYRFIEPGVAAHASDGAVPDASIRHAR